MRLALLLALPAASSVELRGDGGRRCCAQSAHRRSQGSHLGHYRCAAQQQGLLWQLLLLRFLLLRLLLAARLLSAELLLALLPLVLQQEQVQGGMTCICCRQQRIRVQAPAAILAAGLLRHLLPQRAQQLQRCRLTHLRQRAQQQGMALAGHVVGPAALQHGRVRLHPGRAVAWEHNLRRAAAACQLLLHQHPQQRRMVLRRVLLAAVRLGHVQQRGATGREHVLHGGRLAQQPLRHASCQAQQHPWLRLQALAYRAEWRGSVMVSRPGQV